MLNKIILMGRLTKDPEVRYSQGAEPLAIARYTLAVERNFKKDGEPTADFINCTALGRSGEFAEKYFHKGQLIAVVGRLQIRSYDKDGQRQWFTEVVVEEQNFAESKKSFEENRNSIPDSVPAKQSNVPVDFSSISDPIDDDLPF